MSWSRKEFSSATKVCLLARYLIHLIHLWRIPFLIIVFSSTKYTEHSEMQQFSVTVTVIFPAVEEANNSQNLNGHATSSVSSEEVKVDIESPETLQEGKASGPGGTAEKSGNCRTH